MDVTTRAKRILSDLESFRFIDDATPEYVSDIASATEKSLVGFYQNRAGIRNECVVVTEDALYLALEGEVRKIPFRQIETIVTPSSKAAVEGLEIVLDDGSSVFLPVRNGKGRFRDVFEFLRFLNRVKSDLSRFT